MGGQGVERDYLTGGEADVKPVISGPGEDGSMMVITVGLCFLFLPLGS